MSKHRIAVIPGDGIGKEVMPEGLRVLEVAARSFGIELAFDHFDFASCDYFAKHGKMMPDDWKAQIGSHDAIYYGAVGWPAAVPDHISLWGSLLLFRREFDQYINLRPVRLMPGVPSPLANRKPGDIDFYVVRENTEGEYSAVGGKMFAMPDAYQPGSQPHRQPPAPQYQVDQRKKDHRAVCPLVAGRSAALTARFSGCYLHAVHPVLVGMQAEEAGVAGAAAEAHRLGDAESQPRRGKGQRQHEHHHSRDAL